MGFRQRHLGLFAAALMGCLFVTALSHAQVPGIGDACTGNGLLDNVLCKFKTAAGHWGAPIQRAADWLFWTLVIISMVWTFSMHALRRGDILEVLAELTRFTIFVGFFYYLLQNATYIGESIINSLRMLASQAGGVPNKISPSAIIDVGLELVYHVISHASMLSMLDGIFGFAMSGFILVVLATVAVDMLQLLIAAWVLLYAGVFFLGFGGSRWTSDMAIGYFRTLLSIAVQTFAMILLVAVGKGVIDELYPDAVAASDDSFLYTLGSLVVVAYALYRLTSRIPPLLGQLVTGTHASGAAAAGSTLADVTTLGTSAAMSTAFSMGGNLVSSGFSQAAGMVEAYRAATGVARAESKGTGGEAGSVGAGTGPLAAAFGDPVRRSGAAGAAGSASAPNARAATGVSDANQAHDAQQATGGRSASSADAREAQSGVGRGQDVQSEGAARPSQSAAELQTADPSAEVAGNAASATPPNATELGDANEADASDDPSARDAADGKNTTSPAELELDADESASTPGERGDERGQRGSAVGTGVANGAAAQPAAEDAAKSQVSAAASTNPSNAAKNAEARAQARAATAQSATSGSSSADASGAVSGTMAADTAGSAETTPSGGDGADGASSSSSSNTSTSAAAAASEQASTSTTAAQPSDGPGTASAAATGAPTERPPGSDAGRTATGAAISPHGPEARRTALRAGQILGAAALQQAQEAAEAAIESVRARAAARIANTAGGRLAERIRQSHGEPPAASEVAAFSEGGGFIAAPAAADATASAHDVSTRQRASLDDPASWTTGNDAMTSGQAHYLERLCEEAGVPFDPTLSKAEASNLITEMRGGHQPTGVRDDDDSGSA